jgi:8-amino-7-oxononanoate synthase
MELLKDLERELQALDAKHLRRHRRVVDSPCAPHVMVDGRSMLAFCSNDYLGLASHPQVVAALREGALRYGAGSGASPLISGHSRAHALLEERLAAFLGPHLEAPRALYFSNGYMANLGIIQALVGAGDTVFVDRLNHACLIDGARLSRAEFRVYPHGDVARLEALLARCKSPRKLVATDGVFSMDGDIAPLADLLALCEKYGAWLLVDDAHGFGVFGENGRGTLEHFNLRSPHLVYMGTLGKAAGVAGAFVAAHATVVEWLIQRARTYIFSTAEAPALAYALLASLDIIAGDEGAQRRARLRQHIAQLRRELTLERWRRLPSESAIQPLVIGDNDEAVQASAALHAQGLWVPAIRPPTVPANTARLRITLSAAHDPHDISRLAAALNGLESER